jgi:hypothetical protein
MTQMDFLRLTTIQHGLRLQAKNPKVRLSAKLPQATTLARRRLGLKGNLASLTRQVDELVAKALDKKKGVQQGFDNAHHSPPLVLAMAGAAEAIAKANAKVAKALAPKPLPQDILSTCETCGSKVWNLGDRVDIEWFSDTECGRCWRERKAEEGGA